MSAPRKARSPARSSASRALGTTGNPRTTSGRIAIVPRFGMGASRRRASSWGGMIPLSGRRPAADASRWGPPILACSEATTQEPVDSRAWTSRLTRSGRDRSSDLATTTCGVAASAIASRSLRGPSRSTNREATSWWGPSACRSRTRPMTSQVRSVDPSSMTLTRHRAPSWRSIESRAPSTRCSWSCATMTTVVRGSSVPMREMAVLGSIRYRIGSFGGGLEVPKRPFPELRGEIGPIIMGQP